MVKDIILCKTFNYFPRSIGVESIDANIETKDVKVTCRDDVEASQLLEALMNWSRSSGKAVELISN